MPRLVNAIANKSGRRECFSETKERFLGTPESMGKQGHRMRSRACGNKLQRWRIVGERYFLDTDAGLNPMGERDSRDEANGRDSSDGPVSVWIH
jgi:hypothetical protein